MISNTAFKVGIKCRRITQFSHGRNNPNNHHSSQRKEIGVIKALKIIKWRTTTYIIVLIANIPTRQHQQLKNRLQIKTVIQTVWNCLHRLVPYVLLPRMQDQLRDRNHKLWKRWFRTTLQLSRSIAIRAMYMPLMPLFSLRRSSNSWDQQRLPKDRMSSVYSKEWVVVCGLKHQVPGKPTQYHRRECKQHRTIHNNSLHRHGKLQTAVILVVQWWIQWQVQSSKGISSNLVWAQVIHTSSQIRVTDQIKDSTVEAMEWEVLEPAPTLLRSSLRVLVMDLLQVI